MINDPPVTGYDHYSVAMGGSLSVDAPGLLANDTDSEGDPISAKAYSGGADHGWFAVDADGSFHYNAPAAFHGTDHCWYQAYDGKGYSMVSYIYVTVNDGPAVIDHSYVASSGTQLQTFAAPGLLVGATDPEEDDLRTYLEDGPSAGTVTVYEDGHFTYLPPNGTFTGNVTFTYKALDEMDEESNVATVTISVNHSPSISNFRIPTDWPYWQGPRSNNSFHVNRTFCVDADVTSGAGLASIRFDVVPATVPIDQAGIGNPPYPGTDPDFGTLELDAVNGPDGQCRYEGRRNKGEWDLFVEVPEAYGGTGNGGYADVIVTAVDTEGRWRQVSWSPDPGSEPDHHVGFRITNIGPMPVITSPSWNPTVRENDTVTLTYSTEPNRNDGDVIKVEWFVRSNGGEWVRVDWDDDSDEHLDAQYSWQPTTAGTYELMVRTTDNNPTGINYYGEYSMPITVLP